MKTLKEILKQHAVRYPKLEPTDAVKLVYQNEFGAGHMVAQPNNCLTYLRREYEATQKQVDALRYEDIGNGIVRIHLAALQQEELERLGQAFLYCAAQHQGCRESFLIKLDLLREMTQQGSFSFGIGALESYLCAYEQAGFPAVSHSATYRLTYKPAYRIVCATATQTPGGICVATTQGLWNLTQA